MPADQCGLASEATASVGGLVTIAPVAIAELLAGGKLERTQQICRDHLRLTHPDDTLARICDAYVSLIHDLLFRSGNSDAKTIIAKVAEESANVNLAQLCEKYSDDNDIIGGIYTKACPITDSWPGLLYLAYKYNADPKAALLANTNVGGENCHRGSVLGVIVGLSTANEVDELVLALAQADSIAEEVRKLLSAPH